MNKVKSFVDQKFMLACSSQYKAVIIYFHNSDGTYDPTRFTYEHAVVESMISKANVTIEYDNERKYYKASSRVIKWDFELIKRTSSIFFTFNNSVRFRLMNE